VLIKRPARTAVTSRCLTGPWDAGAPPQSEQVTATEEDRHVAAHLHRAAACSLIISISCSPESSKSAIAALTRSVSSMVSRGRPRGLLVDGRCHSRV
jgi:hypothetical protein